MTTATATMTPEWKTGAPVAPKRVPFRPFGAGILASVPMHRLSVSLSDMAWWEGETARAEARDLAQREGEWEAAERLECGGVI